MTDLDFTPLAANPGVIRAPKWPALSASACSLIAVAAGIASWKASGTASLGYAIVGYVLGCLGAIILASTHRALRDKERRNPAFRLDPWLDKVAVLSISVGILAGLWCAFLLATELAK